MKVLVWASVMLSVASFASPVAGENLQPICTTCECMEHTRPYDVDCRNLELYEVPDLSLNNFSSPWILNIDNNLLHEVPVMARQEQLLSLTLKRNRIRKIADGAFKDLINMKKLYLQSNNLTEDSITQEAFRGLHNATLPEPLGLEVLDLSYNHIQFLKMGVFMHLRSLKKLILAHNPIKDISRTTASTIHDLLQLEELDLSQTGIDRLPNHFLTDLRNLQVLILAGNKFKSVPGELNYAHNLIHLNLNANPIMDLSVGDFQENLATLKVLEISAMPDLRNVGPRTFSNLNSLERLSMSSCPKLTNIDQRAFYVLEGDELSLREIHIQDNHLKTLSEKMLPWLDLQAVDIQNNPWSCDCHFRWVAEKLIPDLERKDPGLTLSILCAEPLKDRGTPVREIHLKEEVGFVCKPPGPSKPMGHGLFGPLAVGIIIVGTLLLLTGTMIFAYVLVRKTQSRQMFGETVKYRRAQNEDMEAVQS